MLKWAHPDLLIGMMTDLQTYEAILNDAVYFYQSDAGFLRLTGADRVDFLQRQTTNDLRLLTPDCVMSTVLTSPTARILDVLSVIDEGESLGIVSLPGRGGATSEFLRKRIFFSDQVNVDDLSAAYAQILLFGPQLDAILQRLGLPILEEGHLIKVEVSHQPVTVIVQRMLSRIGCRFLVPVASVDIVKAELDLVGATSISPEVFEILRVEAGQPGPVNELTDSYTPLEMQLDEMISDSKGCYTGQEIIARQITYDKVTKNLVGLKLSSPVENGVKIEAEGKSVGTLTSVVQSPRFGSIGLGVIRCQYREVGTTLTAQNEDGSVVKGVVVELPFR